MPQCLLLTPDELANYLAQGWTQEGGPYSNQADCLAHCGISTSSSSHSTSGPSNSTSGPSQSSQSIESVTICGCTIAPSVWIMDLSGYDYLGPGNSGCGQFCPNLNRAWALSWNPNPNYRFDLPNTNGYWTDPLFCWDSGDQSQLTGGAPIPTWVLVATPTAAPALYLMGTTTDSVGNQCQGPTGLGYGFLCSTWKCFGPNTSLNGDAFGLASCDSNVLTITLTAA